MTVYRHRSRSGPYHLSDGQGNMRIIAGTLRGRMLKSPKGLATRPVLARVREALFLVIGDISGLDVLDLFSGTGAVGIEALSRGAASLTLVEKGRRQCAVIRENVTSFGIENKTAIFRTDALKALKKLHDAGRSFHFIFADPPYDTGLSQKAIERVFDLDILVPDGVLAVTVRHNEDLPGDSGNRELIFDRRYGDTKLVMYRRVAEQEV